MNQCINQFLAVIMTEALAAGFLKTDKTEGNYGTLPSAKLHTVICQTSRSCGAKKLTNANILLFQLIFFSDWKQSKHLAMLLLGMKIP